MVNVWLFVSIFIGGGVTGWLTSKPVQRCGCMTLRTGLLASSVLLLASAVGGAAYFGTVPDRSVVDVVSLVNCGVTVFATVGGIHGLIRLRHRPMKWLSSWLLLSLMLWLGYGGAVLCDPGFFCRRQFDAAMHACAGGASVDTRACIMAIGSYPSFEERCQLEHTFAIVGAIFLTVAYRFALWSIILLVDSGDFEIAAGAASAAAIELNASPRTLDADGMASWGGAGSGAGGAGRTPVAASAAPPAASPASMSNAIELRRGAGAAAAAGADVPPDGHVDAHIIDSAPRRKNSAKLDLTDVSSGAGTGVKRKNSLGAGRLLPSTVAKQIMMGDTDGVEQNWEPHYRSYGFRVTDPDTGDGYRTTPLHAAAAAGHLHMAKWLLEHGCQLSVVDGMGRSPLDVADDTRTRNLLRQHQRTRIWEFV